MRHRGHYVWKKKTSEYLILTDRTLAQLDDSDPAGVTRERFDDVVPSASPTPGSPVTAKEITHDDVEMLRRFGAASLTVVFELPLSDVTVVDGEKAVLDCHDHSLVPRTTYDMPSAPRGSLEVSDVTRSSVTLSWLAPTLDGGATIVAHVIEQSRAPVTDVDARRAGQAADDRLHGRQPGRAERLPIPRLRREGRDLPDRRLSDRFHGDG